MTDTTAADIIAPAIGATVPVSIHDTSGMVAGQDVKISGVAWSIVTVGSSTQFHAGNRSVAPSTVIGCCAAVGWGDPKYVGLPEVGTVQRVFYSPTFQKVIFPRSSDIKVFDPITKSVTCTISNPQSYDFIPCCIGVAFSHIFVERAWQFRCRAHQLSPSRRHPS